MATLRITTLLLGVLLCLQSANERRAQTPLERLHAKIDVVWVGNLAPAQNAGQFNNPSQEENTRTPPMGRDSLFLFPDKTYIYTSFTDVSPDTISDKGTWE